RRRGRLERISPSNTPAGSFDVSSTECIFVLASSYAVRPSSSPCACLLRGAPRCSLSSFPWSFRLRKSIPCQLYRYATYSCARVARGQRGMLRGKMLGPALFVVSGTLASAVSTRSRAAAQAMANVASDGCAGEGVTTTPLLIYASMDRGNKLYSLRGGASKDILDSAEPDNQQEELMSGDDLMTESGNKTGDDKNETPISPLCLALFRSLRGTDDNHKLNFCINQHKEATQQASAFLQEFDENSAQEVLQPTLLKCLRSEVNLPTAQLMEGGGCLSGFTTDP
ncbi:unnamed protein product, partial [Prorocentrum cordatum]